MQFQYTARDAARFWAKVDTSGECWIWTGAKLPAGYGVFTVPCRRNGRAAARTLKAHRVAWELSHGDIPSGMLICHNCPAGDNTSCVRPSHLYLGTHTDNNRDTHAKGRWRSGSAVHPERMPRGSQHPNTQLDEPIVREIRHLRADGMILKDIAVRFGISISTVHAIATGKWWRHVE